MGRRLPVVRGARCGLNGVHRTSDETLRVFRHQQPTGSNSSHARVVHSVRLVDERLNASEDSRTSSRFEPVRALARALFW